MVKKPRIKCFATPETETLLNMLSGHISHDTPLRSDVQFCADLSEIKGTARRMNGGSFLLTAIFGSNESRNLGLSTIGWAPRAVPTIVVFDQDGYRLWQSHPVGRIDMAILVGFKERGKESLDALEAVGASHFWVVDPLPWSSLLYKMVADEIVKRVTVMPRH